MKEFFYLCVFISFSYFSSAQDVTKAYNNFDFVPGEKVLFDDNFTDAKIGEFPPRWNLMSGQATINNDATKTYLIWTEGSNGNISKIQPAMKNKTSYLGESFTMELDFLIPTEDETLNIIFKDKEGDDSKFITYTSMGELSIHYFPNDLELKGTYAGNQEKFAGTWHHMAIAYKNKQIKCFTDQYRELVIPDCGFQPVALLIGGCEKVRITNVKIADGGGMNMLNKILTDGKFISHAVKFDINKSDIKGESMGFLNELAKWLKDNPGVKLEIGGHTDSDGDDAANLKLSQSRAEAVKTYLSSQGIGATRFTAKGYGESKPMDNNTTPEGKANNRRVEFVKI